MLEPPDPVVLCKRCSKAEEDKIVAKTKPPRTFYVPWQPGKCHRRALKRLGMVFAGPRGAAWEEAFWPGQIPKDYTVRPQG
jgi:hypothetical protein